MCGIAGVMYDTIDTKNSKEIYQNMLETLKRRGPNEQGTYVDSYVSFMHTRLAVVDLENGKQPMCYTYKKAEYVLVYNGELYNTEELRSLLIQNGHRFLGHSDTEVLLHAYIEWKEECVVKLNGIFAFSVWDKQQKKLFIARDRLGVKPFFYTIKNGTFLFASQIKTLLQHPLVKPQVDVAGAYELLLLGPGRTPGYGIFASIQELKSGYCGYFSSAGLCMYPYWKLEAQPHMDTVEETIEKIAFLVKDSIQKQLISDVPIGTFLSGGLDSSIITALANEYMLEHGKQLSTFSVDYEENDKYFRPNKFQPNSDTYYIKQMTEKLGTKHTTITVGTEALIQSLFDAVDARDLPGMADIDGSLLLFCEQVKKEITVALSGECADEIFGGYPWYRDPTIREAEGFPWSQSTTYRAGFFKKDFLEYMNPSKYVQQKYTETLQKTNYNKSDSKIEKRMKEMFGLNINWFMQTLLERKDRMSMHHGLEVRVPFCDHRLVSYLYNVPWEIKEYNGREKGLLRQAMKGLLPNEILWRKKSPYPKTHHPRYLEKLQIKGKQLLENKDAPLFTLIKREAFNKLLQDNRGIPWYGQLMTTPQTIAYFLQLNYWLEKFKIEWTEKC